MAPEVVEVLGKTCGEGDRVDYDESCDVYSFGMLLWELTHRKMPFHDVDGKTVATSLVPRGERPPLQLPKCFEAWGTLITACWKQDPKQRPQMSVCAKELNKMFRKLEITKVSAFAFNPAVSSTVCSDSGGGAWGSAEDTCESTCTAVVASTS